MSDWAAQIERYLSYGQVRGYTPSTLVTRKRALLRFGRWCSERDLAPEAVTLPYLVRYQHHLEQARKPDGLPLAPATQQQLLLPLNMFFRWMVRTGQLSANPAADMELPRQPQRLPRSWLTVEEIEQWCAHVLIYGDVGIRDRAIIEVIYSTGLRRFELLALRESEIDVHHATVTVRQGKGRKDRVVPIGERALAWLAKYLEEVRPLWALGDEETALWLRPSGKALTRGQLTDRFALLLREAGIEKPGACHILRHSMATHMLNGGADVRFVQAILGHAQLSTTAIYTHVAIAQLQAVHRATHPSAKLWREDATHG